MNSHFKLIVSLKKQKNLGSAVYYGCSIYSPRVKQPELSVNCIGKTKNIFIDRRLIAQLARTGSPQGFSQVQISPQVTVLKYNLIPMDL